MADIAERHDGGTPWLYRPNGAHVKTCDNCGRQDTRGFTKVGNQFALRGRTRTAQRLNMRSGPAIWECAPGRGCNQ